jgi:hypothetical protein
MRDKYSRAKLMEGFGGKDHPLLFQFIDEVKATKDFSKVMKTESFNFFSKLVWSDEKDKGKMTVVDALQNIDALENDAERLVIMFKVGRECNDAFWKRVIARYCEDLQSVIRNAPPVGQMMKVYRGVKNDYYLKGTVKQKGFHYSGYLADTKYYLNDGFVSTSISRDIAYDFLKGDKCCFNVITLLPGARCLMLFGASRFKEEQEVLLGLETVYLIRQKKVDCKFDTNGFTHKLEGDACQKIYDVTVASDKWPAPYLYRDITVSDIVVVN